MALLKSLIQRLLDSRTTPEEAIHADRINIYTESTFSADTFTAPRDGFVRVWAKIQEGIAGTALGLSVSTTNGGEQGISRFAFTGASSDNSIVQTWPVQKGETIRIECFNLDIQQRTFFDAIGGGYSHIVRRALSCLKPSFNFSPKVFSKAKRRGYLSGRSNWLIPRQSLKYQRQTLGQSSQCRLTVGQLLKAQTILQRRLTATSLKGNTKCSVFASVVSPIALQQFLFRAKKAKPSALPFTQTVRTFPLEHLKHFRLANLETGGALC